MEKIGIKHELRCRWFSTLTASQRDQDSKRLFQKCAIQENFQNVTT